jgi:hypothetical protein
MCVFVAAGMCVPSRCPVTAVLGPTIPAFKRIYGTHKHRHSYKQASAFQYKTVRLKILLSVMRRQYGSQL